MIAIASNCLLFELATGESIPFMAENISVDVTGSTNGLFDAEFVRHAANAVFHYFRYELGRKTVSVAEFAGALEKVLIGFASRATSLAKSQPQLRVLESDLHLLAQESGQDSELFFFSRLRQELRRHLGQAPRVVRFRGLRGCVKRLIGARRWTLRCRKLEEQIVQYLRECLNAEPREAELSLVVD